MDWMQVQSALNLMKIKHGKWPMIFEGLKEMEIEALEYLNQEAR